MRSRALGTIWGNCVADALGGPVQFRDRGTFPLITDLEFVKPFNQPAGSYSDDGSMTLALAKSFIDSKGSYNHELSIVYFLDWLLDGRFSTTSESWDVGSSTGRSLRMWKKCLRRNGVEDGQKQVDEAFNVDQFSGNGSLMRISPVGLILHKNMNQAMDIAKQQGRITHPAQACVDSTVLYTELMCRIIHGESKADLAGAVANFKFAHTTLATRLAKYRTLADWENQSDRNLQSSGWVIDTIEVALWSFFKFNNWKDGALVVVNFGGDSDTAGAVYGALAGAFYGFESIPSEWVNGMQNKSLITDIADGVGNLVEWI